MEKLGGFDFSIVLSSFPPDFLSDWFAFVAFG